MTNENMLDALKRDRDHAIFCNRAESFINRWAPSSLDPRKRVEFTAELMGLFCEMIATRHQIHCEVSAQYFKHSMDLSMLRPMPPVIVGVDRARGPDMTAHWIISSDGTSRPATQKEIAEMNLHEAEKNAKKGTSNEG